MLFHLIDDILTHKIIFLQKNSFPYSSSYHYLHQNSQVRLKLIDRHLIDLITDRPRQLVDRANWQHLVDVFPRVAPNRPD